MGKKISIEQIASWRSGEMITEQKLNEIFSLIGKVINLQSDDIDLIVKNLNDLKLATRWVGQVENYKDIPSFIDANKNNPEFQPPNNPLPTSGDVIFVNNNSDDPNLDPSINPGKYIYIYQSNIEGKEGTWTLYNPFALVNASPNNDGLMSKEDKIKLDTLPNGQELDFKLDGFENELTIQQKLLTQVKITSDINKKDIANLKPRVDNLEQTKQDKATNLKNYKTKNVEDNLVEVKTIVDNIANQDIVLWQERENNGKFNVSGNTFSATLPNWNATLENGSFIKIYATITTPLLETIELVDTIKVIEGRSASAGVVMFSDRVPNHYVVDFNNGVINFNFTNTLPSLGGDNIYEVTKVIKDIGMSDYTWSENLKSEINTMLGNTLGIKKQLIYANRRPDEFNGFRTNDEFKLSFTYVNGFNALELYLGGTKLTKGVEWDEVVSQDVSNLSDKIVFLKDINIDKEGAIDVIGFAIVANTFTFGIWDATTKWGKGQLVLDEGKVYYAKKDNVGVKPSSDATQEYWVQFDTNIDINAVKNELKQWITQEVSNQLPSVLPPLIDDALDKAPSANMVIEYAGEVHGFESERDFENFKTLSQTDDSYWESVNDYNVATYFTPSTSSKDLKFEDFDNGIRYGFIEKNRFNKKGFYYLKQIFDKTGAIPSQMLAEIPLTYNISDEEQWTGNYFFGKKIYVKKFSGVLNGSNIKILDNVDVITNKNFFSQTIQGSQYKQELPYYLYDSNTNLMKVLRIEINTNGEVYIVISNLTGTLEYNGILYYTKRGE